MLRKEYSKLAKKYGLPPFKQLDNDFEISRIEDARFLLREIRRKIREKIHAYRNLIGQIIEPETSLISVHESIAFNQKGSKEVYALFRKLMELERKDALVAIYEKEADTARFIKEASKEWNRLKEQLYRIVNSLVDAWKKSGKKKERVAYLG